MGKFLLSPPPGHGGHMCPLPWSSTFAVTPRILAERVGHYRSEMSCLLALPSGKGATLGGGALGCFSLEFNPLYLEKETVEPGDSRAPNALAFPDAVISLHINS